MMFPDKYEIGISNLGVRILYEQINNQTDYMCDRAYAPEKDFCPESLYGVESKHALKDFDAIGISIQYELSYPTILKMLDMSGIPYKNQDRKDSDPIIIAGGPCCFNPLPMSDFIDVFMIGDGEKSIVEICKVLEKTATLPREERIREICKLKGCWSKLVGGKVQKNTEQLDFETAVKSYPIPFSSSIHDRAVVEIRRGCGRMCRFCQPGHVTLPVRERSGEDIVKIAKELVKNTGYDEYSLLSLSSNDYGNIKEVIKELSCEFDAKKVSVSLPSQRIDGFNLELANLTQSVRKSTMTLAPEAGSQRLRDFIKKNISEEQIINAALTLYENGWSKIKFYFIAGLPSETLEDMDEMAELLEKIRYKSRLIKKEKDLKHSLDITCTLSIFVPKPFTPFQWFGQMDLDKVTEHIHYLKDRIKKVKGVKINYHEKFVSQIEAVLTRGDETLCAYVEELFKNGCYLDAWGEHFDKNVWQECAKKVGIILDELSTKNLDTNMPLPWDFIDIGVDKEWLIKEFEKSKSFFVENYEKTENNKATTQPTCETVCVNCGVCKNLGTKKVIAPKYQPKITNNVSKTEDENNQDSNNRILYRYRIKISKTGNLRYFSHLDWQNTFLKALARSGLKIAFTQGFNPTMKVSMGVALPLFVESDCELVDVELLEDITVESFREKLEKTLVSDSKIINIEKIEKSAQSIDTTVYWAEYSVEPISEGGCDFENFCYNCRMVLDSDEIVLEKKTKKGLLKKINIKSSIKSYRFDDKKLYLILKTGQNFDIAALRADELMKLISQDTLFNIRRLRFFDEYLKEL